MEAWVDVGMGCGEGTGEGLGIGTGVEMGVGMTRWAGALATELVVKEDRTWVRAMTGRLPNPNFEGDFHPMPSGWAETKLSSRHGDEEHAVVPQHRSVTCAVGRRAPEGPEPENMWSALRTSALLPFHDCHSGRSPSSVRPALQPCNRGRINRSTRLTSPLGSPLCPGPEAQAPQRYPA